MSLRNKDNSLFTQVRRYFIGQFLLAAASGCFLLNIFALRVATFDQWEITYAGLAFGAVALLFFRSNAVAPSTIPSYLSIANGIGKYVFFVLIMLISGEIFLATSNIGADLYSLGSQLPISFDSICVITILLGYLLLHMNRSKIEKELVLEIKRPTNKIGVVLLIIVTLVIFVAVKYPYAGLDFSGYYDMKYSSYVEPAIHMLDSGPLHNERRYQAMPKIFDDGIYTTFGNYPLMEWGIYGSNKLFPFLGIELNTRLFTTLLGVLLLVSIYFFLKYFQGDVYSVFVLFLLSINAIIQFFSYVTVYDLFLAIFFFWSLTVLLRGLSLDDKRTVYLSGIIAGIGINLKYSLIIYLAPAAIVLLLFFKKPNLKDFLINGVLFVPNLVLQTLYFRMSIRYLPENPLIYGGIFLLLVAGNAFIYSKAENIACWLNAIYENPRNKNSLLIGISLFSIAIGIFLLNIPWIGNYIARNFITDQYLIFNWNMYSSILTSVKGFLTPPLFYLALLAMPTLIIIRDRKLLLLNACLFVSSAIYFVLASKVLYFHVYYLNPLIIAGVIMSWTTMYCLSKIYGKYFGYFLIFMLLLSTIPLGTLKINDYLSKTHSAIRETALYLNHNLRDDEYFMFNNIPTSITLYSNRKSFSEDTLAGLNEDGSLRDIFKPELVRGITVGDSMINNKIKYYVINANYGFSKVGFASLYSDNIYNRLNSISFRTRIILCEQGSQCVQDENTKTINRLFEIEVVPYLVLERQIGDYQIYRFATSTNQPI